MLYILACMAGSGNSLAISASAASLLSYCAPHQPCPHPTSSPELAGLAGRRLTWLVVLVGWCVGCLVAGAGHCVTVLAGWWWRASVGGRAQHTWAARETELSTTRHRATPHTAAQPCRHHQPPHTRHHQRAQHCVTRPPSPPPRSPRLTAAPPYMAGGMFCDCRAG